MTADAQKPKVLFIDDEEDLCEVIKDGLEKQGFSVQVASSARQGRELMATIDAVDAIDIVVSDIRMPEESGLDFLKSVRLARNLVPFILVSGHMEIDNQTAQKLGADAAIAKPFKIASLAEKIRSVLKNRELFAAATKT